MLNSVRFVSAAAAPSWVDRNDSCRVFMESPFVVVVGACAPWKN